MFAGKIRLVQNFDEDLKLPVKAEKRGEGAEGQAERPIIVLSDSKPAKAELPPVEPPKSPVVPPQNGPAPLNPGQKVVF
jgi:hypothetical protein